MVTLKSCKDCGAAFPTARNLERHRRSVHFKIKDFICGQCGRAFSAKADLKRHERNKHAEVGGMIPSHFQYTLFCCVPDLR